MNAVIVPSSNAPGTRHTSNEERPAYRRPHARSLRLMPRIQLGHGRPDVQLAAIRKSLLTPAIRQFDRPARKYSRQCYVGFGRAALTPGRNYHIITSHAFPLRRCSVTYWLGAAAGAGHTGK